MSSQAPGPLSDADFRQIQERFKDLENAEREIEKAMNAGLDVSAQRAQAKTLREQLTRIRQTYFPGKF